MRGTSNIETVRWECYRCNSVNQNSNTFHSYELPSSLDESLLERARSTDDTSISSPRLSPSVFMPSAHSSPVDGRAVPGTHIPQHSAASLSHSSQCLSSASSAHDDLSPKHHNMRTLVVNANGILGKSAMFGNLIDYTKPDKLDPSIKSGEFMPPVFSPPIRRDRNKHGGGGWVGGGWGGVGWCPHSGTGLFHCRWGETTWLFSRDCLGWSVTLGWEKTLHWKFL